MELVAPSIGHPYCLHVYSSSDYFNLSQTALKIRGYSFIFSGEFCCSLICLTF